MVAVTECLAPLARAVRHWRVRRDGDPLVTPRGCVAFGRVAGATEDARAARHVGVKVACTGSDEGLAWAALRHFGGRGCVRLLDHAGDAILVERALPGRPLADLVRAGRDDEATGVLCDVATALHEPDAPGAVPTFPSAADWGRGFERYRRSGDAAIPAALVGRAEAHFRELVASQAAPRLLHGDLHHANVLLDATRAWLAIDPKGVLGLQDADAAGSTPAAAAAPKTGRTERSRSDARNSAASARMAAPRCWGRHVAPAFPPSSSRSGTA